MASNHNTVTLSAVFIFLLMPVSSVFCQSQPSQDPTDAGKAIYRRANCFGCHKWHGHGGGGYGGDALSLRNTELTREQIIETVACGRPGTGMPYFARGSYDATKCYDMNRQDAGKEIPPEGGTFLRPGDIDAVTDYVLAHIKGKGEPNYDERIAFFGNTSRVCDVHKGSSSVSGNSPSGAGAAK